MYAIRSYYGCKFGENSTSFARIQFYQNDMWSVIVNKTQAEAMIQISPKVIERNEITRLEHRVLLKFSN